MKISFKGLKQLPKGAKKIFRNTSALPTYANGKVCVCGVSLKHTHMNKKGPNRWLECSRCGYIGASRKV